MKGAVPVAVGIVGDPNAGKSVFTYLLFMELVRRGRKRVFRQEGDPSAPTGPWYLESGADELRRRTKTPWDWKKVEWVRDSVANLKRVFDVVLVDLGGGKPPEVRVTPELAEILKSVDAVAILCPVEREKECFEGWKRELRERAPHVKVVLECVSTLHGVSEYKSPFECKLGGLDRKRATNPPEHLKAALEEIADYVEQLA